MKDKFHLEVTGPSTAYLRLPAYSDELHDARSLPLTNLLGAYKGPYVVLDFKDDVLVGIEIIDESDDDREGTGEA